MGHGISENCTVNLGNLGTYLESLACCRCSLSMCVCLVVSPHFKVYRLLTATPYFTGTLHSL